MKDLFNIVVNDDINKNIIPLYMILYFNEINTCSKKVLKIEGLKNSNEDIFIKEFPKFNSVIIENDEIYFINDFVEEIKTHINNGICFNRDNQKIISKDLEFLIFKYAEGIQQGYKNSMNEFKQNENIVLNEQNAFSIFMLIYRQELEKVGRLFKDIEYDFIVLDKKSKKAINIKSGDESEIVTINKKIILDANEVFNSGFKFGELYKAWEIIFDFPYLFEKFFIKYLPKYSVIPEDILESGFSELKIIKEKKIPEKLYALYYFAKLNIENNHPPINSTGDLDSKKISEIGNKYSGRKGQGFYKELRELWKKDWRKNSTKVNFINIYGKDWEENIKKISEKDKRGDEILNYLKTLSPSSKNP